MFFVILIHLIGGAIFNLFFTYCLTRFAKYAGTAGGGTSGGMYLVTSIVMAGLLSVVTVTGPYTLALCYLLLAVLVGVFCWLPGRNMSSRWIDRHGKIVRKMFSNHIFIRSR